MRTNAMDFVSFSRYELTSGDIDPDYMFIRAFSLKNRFSNRRVLDWLMLKVVVYNSVSELHYLLHNVPFKKLSFGAERRKSKDKADVYYSEISCFFKETALNHNTGLKILSAADNPLEEIQGIHGFGPWAAWKFCDLLDCVMGYNLLAKVTDFRKAYEFPLKGLLMVNGYEENTRLLAKDGLYNHCMEKVYKMLKPVMKVKTPHNADRGVRINEIETLLCKYHSYMHGKYHPGEDVERLITNIRSSPYPEINKFPSLW
jgi:hypothetical protein